MTQLLGPGLLVGGFLLHDIIGCRPEFLRALSPQETGAPSGTIKFPNLFLIFKAALPVWDSQHVVHMLGVPPYTAPAVSDLWLCSSQSVRAAEADWESVQSSNRKPGARTILPSPW